MLTTRILVKNFLRPPKLYNPGQRLRLTRSIDRHCLSLAGDVPVISELAAGGRGYQDVAGRYAQRLAIVAVTTLLDVASWYTRRPACK
jgi:hypothetical protein